MTGPGLDELTSAALTAGRNAGLDAVGVASAEPFYGTRRDLDERKAAGLHGGMAFTYRNPERSTDPEAALPGARALVVGARCYRREVPARPSPRPHGFVARYSWRDHYQPLRDALSETARVVKEAGFSARVLVDDNALVDRAAAHRAGLGWWGKSANLLLPTGSWFVLGAVVTDAPLRPSGSQVADGCGSCTRCIDSCPTGAIVAPGVVDARRCLAWLLQDGGSFPPEHRAALGGRIYGCDECQEVCPPNKVLDRRDPPSSPDPGDEAWVDLVALLRMGDGELLARYGRWYIAKRDPSVVRRNALVVLGNVAAPNDTEVCEILREYASRDDEVLSEHAAWALARLEERAASETSVLTRRDR